MEKNDGCYPQEIFINASSIKKFICPIDFGVCRDPVLDQCGHSFGRSCINLWVKKKNTCPLTNNAYSENPSFPENYAIKEFLNDLKVKCINHENHCDWQGLLDNLDGHLKKECGMELIICENEKCEKKCMRKELPEHLGKECLYTEIECVFKSKGCQQKMQRYLWANHLGEVHHMQLKEILENYDKNENELNRCMNKINEQQIELDHMRNDSIGKEKYDEIFTENNTLKSQNSTLQQEIQDLEYKVKEICLKLLAKEKEAKMMESHLSNLKDDSNASVIMASSQVNHNQSSNLKTFGKSHTVIDDVPPNKKQNHLDFNHNLYNYPPQMMVYNPITGGDLTQTRNFTPQMPIIEQQPQFIDPTIFDIPAHENSINYLLLFTVSEGKKYLASCSIDNLIKIWDVVTYQLVKLLQGHVAAVYCLLYIKDIYTLVSGGNDGTIRLWSANTWECLKIIDGRAKIRCLLNYSKTSEFLTGGLDNKIRLWKSDKGAYSHETLASLEGEVSAMEGVSFDENYELLAGDSKGNVCVIREDPSKRNSYFNSFLSKVHKSLKCHDGKILSLKYVKEKGAFISCSLSDGKLKIWDKINFQLMTELFICSPGYCINDIKYDNSVNLVIIGTSDEKIVSISSLDWNIKKTYEKEGYGVNNIECDLRSGFIYSCGAYRDKKDGKYKYIIRVRRV